jgi:hypothetical protein
MWHVALPRLPQRNTESRMVASCTGRSAGFVIADGPCETSKALRRRSSEIRYLGCRRSISDAMNGLIKREAVEALRLLHGAGRVA